MTKRKCGDDFRLSVRRFWQNPSKNKRYNAPHLDSMGYAQRIAQSHNYTRNRCCSVILLLLKTVRFSNKDCENTFYVCCHGKMPFSTTKLKINFETSNTPSDIVLFITIWKLHNLLTELPTATVAPTIGSVATKPPFFKGRFGGNVNIVTTQW